MRKKLPLVCILLFLTLPPLIGQNRTVGRMQFDNTQTFPGYTLFTPFLTRVQYLINNCGEVVHTWESDDFVTHSVYLTEEGQLFRIHPTKIQLVNWDGTVDFEFNNPEGQFHHDAALLPNGNILVQCAIPQDSTKALAAGRMRYFIPFNGNALEEQIWEIDPTLNGGEIVWRWSIWDHTIQDRDSSKPNFGLVAAHPELLDINYLDVRTADFIHPNGLDYNPKLDQIMYSSRDMHELYIIDHSTTTAEAASHSGGRYGKGGDLLYRWGNPHTYDAQFIERRKLFGQHHPHWIPDSLKGAGQIILFNNGYLRDPDYSEIFVVYPPQSSPGVYYLEEDGTYGPRAQNWTYRAETPTDFFSEALSGVQRLPNGNTLICEGNYGRMIEVNDQKETVWEYINPHSYFGPLEQGVIPDRIATFRALKYPLDFPGFAGKDLSPQGPIELNPIAGDTCNLEPDPDVPVIVDPPGPFSLRVYPNPVSKTLTVLYNPDEVDAMITVRVIDAVGKTIGSSRFVPGASIEIDFSSFPVGLYTLDLRSLDWHKTTRVLHED